MTRIASGTELAQHVRSTRQLLDGGWSHRALANGRRAGVLHHFRRNWYMSREVWDQLWPDGKHLAHTLAVARDLGPGAVVSHASAAALWDLPLVRTRLDRVHLSYREGAAACGGTDALRHQSALPAEDVTTRYGVRCTTLARTVFDLARCLALESAVAVADAAERIQALRGRVWDVEACAAWRECLERRVKQARGARGIRQARWVLEFADGRSQLPGESVSRVQLWRIGFQRVRLQVPVVSPSGGNYFVDFAIDDADAFGEFDGMGKYEDEQMRAGSLAEALLAEKRREDWIRGKTQRKFARWGWEHLHSPQTLAARLAEFSIYPS